MTNVPNSPTPAGWFPDSVPGQLRYWDGNQWTEHVAPANAPAAPQQQFQAPQAPQVQTPQFQAPQFQAPQFQAPGAFPQTTFAPAQPKPKLPFPKIGWLAVLGALAGIGSSFLPWITWKIGSSDVNIFGNEGDGVLTAVAAGLALILGGIGMAKNSKALVIIAIVSAAIGLAISVYHLSDAEDELLKAVDASVGIGVYGCVAGFAVCILGLLASLKRPTGVQ
jgi:hypothetical protein